MREEMDNVLRKPQDSAFKKNTAMSCLHRLKCAEQT